MRLLFFAVVEEAEDTVRSLGLSEVGPGRWRGEGVEVLLTGIGPGPAERCAREALARYPSGPPVVCLGFAGGLHPRLSPGHLVVADRVLPSAGGEAVEVPPSLVGWAVSALAGLPVQVGPVLTAEHPVEHPAQKVRLARETGALTVDMETGAVARVCREAGAPFVAVRAVLDPAGMGLPPFATAMAGGGGRWAAIPYLGRRPLALLGLLRLAGAYRQARRALTGAGVALARAPLPEGTR